MSEGNNFPVLNVHNYKLFQDGGHDWVSFTSFSSGPEVKLRTLKVSADKKQALVEVTGELPDNRLRKHSGQTIWVNGRW